MNENLRKLMLEAGYAAPDIATRANLLSRLLVKECARLCQEEWNGDSLDDICKQMIEYFGFDNANIMAGAEIHSGGGYTESTWDGYNEFVKNRNRNEPTL